jgi:hypothetical protein
MPLASCPRVSHAPAGPDAVAPRTILGVPRMSCRIEAIADRPAFVAEINSLHDRMIRDASQLTIRTACPPKDDRASGFSAKQAPPGRGRS